MAAPISGSNGVRTVGESAATQAEAAERATSSVLALDGWGRLDPPPPVNGSSVVERETEAEEASEPPEALETAPEAEEASGPAPEPMPEAEPVQQAWGATEEIEEIVEPSQSASERAAAPMLRLFGPALVFGLAVGAVVGAGLRWWELRNAPPAPPPPTDPVSRLRRRLDQLQHERATEIAEVRRRLEGLGVVKPAPVRRSRAAKLREWLGLVW